MTMANETANLTEPKDENFFIRVLKYFVPCKGDDRSEVMRKIIFIASVVLFVFSVGELRDFLKADEKDKSYVMQVANEYEPNFKDEVSLNNNTGDENNTSAPGQSSKREVQGWAKKLMKKNSDVKGWIKIPGFKNAEGNEYINFPVLQGKDNDYYLHKNLDKDYYESGSIFIDAWAKVTKAEQSDNLTVYGHNMRYVGTAFTHLQEYKRGADFLRQFPIIEFNTIYDSGCKYVIVGCFVSNIYENQDDGKLFAYNAYRNFDNKDHNFKEWLSQVKKRSWYSSNVKCDENDKYITLSTCSNECEDLRWVIVAKKVTADDDLDKIAAAYKDKQDKDIYFPACWRNLHGSKVKYFGWDY